jgi:hypothetical protein
MDEQQGLAGQMAGAGNEQQAQMQQLIMQVIELLQKGVSPDELIQQGVPPEIVQKAIEMLKGSQGQPAPMPEDAPMTPQTQQEVGM